MTAPPAERAPRFATLPTLREREVLALVAQGCTNEEIGRRLYVSASMARLHLKRLCEKLGARNRAHAVHLAHRWGLLDVDVTAP